MGSGRVTEGMIDGGGRLCRTLNERTLNLASSPARAAHYGGSSARPRDKLAGRNVSLALPRQTLSLEPPLIPSSVLSADRIKLLRILRSASFLCPFARRPRAFDPPRPHPRLPRLTQAWPRCTAVALIPICSCARLGLPLSHPAPCLLPRPTEHKTHNRPGPDSPHNKLVVVDVQL